MKQAFIFSERARAGSLLLLALLPLAASLALAPVPADRLAVVFPPWWPAERSLAAAGLGGAVLRQGAGGFVMIVAPDGADALGRLRQAGAWLFLDPQGLGGCLGPAKE